MVVGGVGVEVGDVASNWLFTFEGIKLMVKVERKIWR